MEAKMYKKILVPLDGSELAECALNHVKNMVKEGAAGEVTLFNVVIAPVLLALTRGVGMRSTIRKVQAGCVLRVPKENGAFFFILSDRFYDETLPYFWLGRAGPSDVLHRQHGGCGGLPPPDPGPAHQRPLGGMDSFNLSRCGDERDAADGNPER
jgi:hypothetical protein